jgi:PKD repeat protein
MRGRGLLGLLLAGASALAFLPAGLGQEAGELAEPLLVNYGTGASIRQGDNDHRQAIYLSVPAGTSGPLYVRIFDPDTVNFHDQMDRRYATTRTRFTVFGGEGAFIPEPTDPEKLTEAELTAGTKLAERSFGRERRTDNKWVTLAELDPAAGQRVGDRIVFRLVVDAISGPNGNVYDVGLSTREDENVAPDGLEMFAYTATVRMPRRGVLTELRFRVPEDQRSLTVGNFDAAFGEAYLTTPFAWYPLIPSGQGVMETTTITLPERDRGNIVAVTLSGGQEYPNDATFYVEDERGRLLPLELPPRLFTLNNRPIARIDVKAPEVCGRTVAFSGARTTDPEGDPLTFTWRFGDGSSEAARDATHSYAEEGRYVATLEVSDPGPQLGSGSAASVSLFLKDPPVARSEKRLLVGAGEETVFDGSPSSASKWNVVRHRWDFGDGTVIDGETVAHAFAEPGLYTVTHTIVDDSGHRCNTASETFAVRVNAGPVAAAGEDRRLAIGEETMFDAAASTDSDGTIVRYEWDFGDGNRAEGAAVRHAYAAPGTYTVGLRVSDDSAVVNSSDEDSLTVIVNDPPIPEAGADKSVAIGQTVTFDASASLDRDGTILAYEWDFGDGTSAGGPIVSHAYDSSGTYPVTLTVTDDSTTRTAVVSDGLSVRVNEPPVAEAGEDRRIAIAEETVFDAAMSADADGEIVSWFWDFGDGNSATGPVVAHRFGAPGTYTVRLRVDDGSKVANSSRDDSLTVIVNDPPVPAAGPDRNVAIGEPIVFDAGETRDRDGAIAAWHWDFGDGNSADGPVAEHAYAKSGRYLVTLTVTDDSTTRTDTASDILSVRVNEPPVANAGPDQHVTASLIQFDGSASRDADDAISLYAWDFGDGGAGEGPAPSHVYAEPGTYQVTLTVTDASETIRNTASDSLTVIVNARPIADAGPDLVAAPGETVTLQATRSLDPDGTIAAYEWDFRDGETGTGEVVRHAFAEPGTYAVRLTVRDDTGHEEAVDHAETTVFVNARPVAEAGADIAAAPGDEVRFSAAASYDSDGSIASWRWDFSDLDEPMEGPEIVRVFDQPGVYSAQLTVTDDSGASNAVAVDSLRIAINHRPVADAGPRIVTDKTTITFDGTRSLDADGDPLAYHWDFGDGTRADGAVVTHTYAAGGIYPVVLTVDDGTGLDNSSARTATEVAINRAPVAVAGENTEVCTGDIVVLDGSQSTDPEGGVLRYAWDFGDGTGSEVVNPTKTYLKGGTYAVTLTVRDDSGLANGVAADQIAVRVDQGPVAHAGEDILACAGTEVEFDGSGSTDIDGVVNSFTWDFGDGNLGGGETPVHIYDRPGTYRVFLSIEGEKAGICDSTSRDEIQVRIIEGPVAVIAAPAAVPITETVTFDGSASRIDEGRITAYEWDFGDGNTASGATVSHRYAAPGVYAVSLRLTSDSASPTCQAVSTRHLIRVNAPPLADAGADLAVAAGEEAVFDASASRDPDGGIVAYEWDFGDGTTASGIAVRHRYAEPGTYTARLTVRDEAGLANSEASDTIVVTVNPEPAPAIEGPAVACVAEEVAWRAVNQRGEGTTWRWIFGDGGEADKAAATHAYAAPGRYSLVLHADDGKGLPNSRMQTTRIVHVNRSPEAVAGPDRMVCPGDTVSFDADLSRDIDGTITRYEWDFGDGTKAEGAQVDHAYAAPGTYAVTLTVTDDAGSSCSVAVDTLSVMVNASPVADAGGDRNAWVGGANDAILLDGSASTDPDGQALSHAWTIGGEGELGERVRHTLTATGDIPVTLTVSDTSGLACGTASTTFTIHARPR